MLSLSEKRANQKKKPMPFQAPRFPHTFLHKTSPTHKSYASFLPMNKTPSPDPSENNSGPSSHDPVMLKEVLEKLAPQEGLFLDATFGRGGYTKAILAGSKARVIALDRDADAIAFGQKHFKEVLENGRLQLCHARFSDIAHYVEPKSLDGVVFDFGLSSPQIAQASRGFSFSADGPLDMQMGLSHKKASDFLNNASEKDIAHTLWTLGGEKRSRALASRIVAERTQRPFTHTRHVLQLFGLHISPTRAGRKGAIHPATRTFQALRMWVNDDLTEIKTALSHLPPLFKEGGRLVTVAFHSGEDRLVKHFLKPPTQEDLSRHMPISPRQADLHANHPPFTVPSGQPCKPSPKEIERNPRARSAKLRWAFFQSAPNASKRTAPAHTWGNKPEER